MASNYKRGYNHGYHLARLNPKLLETLKSGLKKDSEYFKALSAGEKEYNKKRVAELEQLQKKNNKQRGLGR